MSDAIGLHLNPALTFGALLVSIVVFSAIRTLIAINVWHRDYLANLTPEEREREQSDFDADTW